MVTSAEELNRQPLFGGMAIIELPDRFGDVSDFRPVPDHQEVLADASTDQSIIIEILVRSLGGYASQEYFRCAVSKLPKSQRQ
jgi:hypothetical protein